METDRAGGGEAGRGGFVLLVGAANESILAHAKEAAHASRVELTRCLAEELEDLVAERRPVALLFDLAERATKDAVLHVRNHAELANLPILGLTEVPDEVTLQEIFWWGMDDLVGGDVARGLTARLRMLASRPEPSSRAPDGTVVIEGRDASFRALIGRLFANTGHNVRFAVTSEQALEEAAAPGVSLVVSSAGDGADPLLTVARARQRGIDVPWLVGARPADEVRLRQRILAMERVGLFDTFAPPENALFHANELRRSYGVESRRSPRVLYGALVRFRPAGAEEDDFAWSYNVSASGLFLRALAMAPTGTDLRIEMLPPRTERRVRFVAKVVWTRPFGPSHAAVVPPGMGIVLVSSGPEEDRYREGVRLLVESRGHGGPAEGMVKP